MIARTAKTTSPIASEILVDPFMQPLKFLEHPPHMSVEGMALPSGPCEGAQRLARIRAERRVRHLVSDGASAVPNATRGIPYRTGPQRCRAPISGSPAFARLVRRVLRFLQVILQPFFRRARQDNGQLSDLLFGPVRAWAWRKCDGVVVDKGHIRGDGFYVAVLIDGQRE